MVFTPSREMGDDIFPAHALAGTVYFQKSHPSKFQHEVLYMPNIRIRFKTT